MAAAGLTLQEAAWLAVSIPLDYAQRDNNLAWAALAGRSAFQILEHHPRRDVVDRASGTRFFYHAHPVPGDALQEHGHFHLFHEDARGFCHLAALSLDAQGRPLRWFCTNQWVTGERWRAANRWRAVIQSFQLQTSGRLAPVARWLSAMVALYREELMALLHERDGVMARAGRTRAQFNNRQMHILCSRPISLQSKLQSLL